MLTGDSHRGEPTGKMVKLPSGLDAYLATAPEGKAHQGAGIVYVADIFGIWNNSKLMADQFAANGYTTIIPDIFNGDVMPYPPQGIDIMSWIMNGANGDNPHTPAQVDPIVVEAIKYLKDQGITKIGGVGYCFGAKVCHSQSRKPKNSLADRNVVRYPQLQGGHQGRLRRSPLLRRGG